MDARTLETRGTPNPQGGDTWRVMWQRDGLPAPTPAGRSFLVGPDADPNGRRLRRTWFRDYEEVE
jgi:hypothetical protein